MAPTSSVFILGRAIAGVGYAGIISGAFAIITVSVPLRQRALIGGIAGGVESIAGVCGPLLGGVLTDSKLTWRGCFGINVPLGILSAAIIAFMFQNPHTNPNEALPFKEKMSKFDFLGTMVFIPSITCLLLALQWGGSQYGWVDARIIVLLVLFGLLLTVFGYIQHRRGDGATLPPRILKQRSIIAGAWFACCSNATLAVVEYYMAIYFQVVKGYSASKSGVLCTPQIIALCISGLIGGVATTKFGYYTRKPSAAS